MTDHYYPDAIKATAEHITLGFNVDPDGGVSLNLFAVCTSPVGAICINISPQHAAELYRTLHGIHTLNPQQREQLADVIATASKEN